MATLFYPESSNILKAKLIFNVRHSAERSEYFWTFIAACAEKHGLVLALEMRLWVFVVTHLHTKTPQNVTFCIVAFEAPLLHPRKQLRQTVTLCPAKVRQTTT